MYRNYLAVNETRRCQHFCMVPNLQASYYMAYLKHDECSHIHRHWIARVEHKILHPSFMFPHLPYTRIRCVGLCLARFLVLLTRSQGAIRCYAPSVAEFDRILAYVKNTPQNADRSGILGYQAGRCRTTETNGGPSTLASVASPSPPFLLVLRCF